MIRKFFVLSKNNIFLRIKKAIILIYKTYLIKDTWRYIFSNIKVPEIMSLDRKDFSNIEILHETFNNIFNMRYT